MARVSVLSNIGFYLGQGSTEYASLCLRDLPIVICSGAFRAQEVSRAANVSADVDGSICG